MSTAGSSAVEHNKNSRSRSDGTGCIHSYRRRSVDQPSTKFAQAAEQGSWWRLKQPKSLLLGKSTPLPFWNLCLWYFHYCRGNRCPHPARACWRAFPLIPSRSLPSSSSGFLFATWDHREPIHNRPRLSVSTLFPQPRSTNYLWALAQEKTHIVMVRIMQAHFSLISRRL